MQHILFVIFIVNACGNVFDSVQKPDAVVFLFLHFEQSVSLEGCLYARGTLSPDDGEIFI